jgi:hypothetical protein
MCIIEISLCVKHYRELRRSSSLEYTVDIWARRFNSTLSNFKNYLQSLGNIHVTVAVDFVLSNVLLRGCQG